MPVSLSFPRPAALAAAMLLSLAMPHALAADGLPEEAVRKIVDTGDQQVLAAAQKYLELAKDHADDGDVATLGAAQAHADAGDTATLRSAASRAAAGDVATLAAATAHADAGDARTLESASRYASQADQQVLAAARKYAEASQDHADRGDAATLRSANAYTDQRVAATVQPQLDALREDVWSRMATTDRRINRIGAMGSAMTQMAVNASNGGGERGRLAVGVGYTEGEKAVSVGYGLRVGRGSFSLGAAFGGGETSVGAGIGVDL